MGLVEGRPGSAVTHPGWAAWLAGLVLAVEASAEAGQLVWDPGRQFEASVAAVANHLAGALVTEESHPGHAGRDPVLWGASADLRPLDWLVAVGVDWAGFVGQGGSGH